LVRLLSPLFLLSRLPLSSVFHWRCRFVSFVLVYIGWRTTLQLEDLEEDGGNGEDGEEPIEVEDDSDESQS
jgi:hypothetical protein